MEDFETRLAKATAPGTRRVLGAIGLVVDDKGNTLYHHASGHQSLDHDAPPLDPNSTIALASAGKFITHIAALQLVERGVISLDEPVYKHIPELETLQLISRCTGDKPFALRTPANKITLRHLLLHTSGLSDKQHPLVRDAPKPQYGEDAHFLVKSFAIPLIFEPGEGFCYGNSLHFTQLLVERLSKSFGKHIREHIFNPLGMASSTYAPRDNADVWNRRLRMVERDGDMLVPCDDQTQGLTCSMTDMGVLFSDLLSPASKLLRPESIDLLFTGQLAPSSAAKRDLRADPENYAFVTGKVVAGEPGSAGPPSVDWSAAGLVAEDELPLSQMPKGTVTWEGWPNVLWAMNREKGLAMYFATQLVPVGDAAANDLAVTFMRDAWNKFG